MIFCSSAQAAADFLSKKVVRLGETVPDFELKDTTSTVHKLSSDHRKIVMIHFWSATCPFVIRYQDELKSLTDDYGKQGVISLGIDSNKNEKLEDIKKVAAARKLNYPVLLDLGNKVADQFGAVTTPHLFLIDKEGKLIYEGAVDDQGWSENNIPKKFYARDALEQAVKGIPVTVPQTKSVGCTIKRF